MEENAEKSQKTVSDADSAAPQMEGPRSFTVFIRNLSDGEAEKEISYQLHELTKRLQEISHITRGKAKGKLKLVIRLVADVNQTVGVAYEVDVVQPKMPTTPAVYWMTKGGNLSPTDTRQLELRPREVPNVREVREAPAPSVSNVKEV